MPHKWPRNTAIGSRNRYAFWCQRESEVSNSELALGVSGKVEIVRIGNFGKLNEFQYFQRPREEFEAKIHSQN